MASQQTVIIKQAEEIADEQDEEIQKLSVKMEEMRLSLFDLTRLMQT